MTKETELATVVLEEVSCEFMYSNPNGMFNLSIPEKMWRNPSNYQQMSYQSWKIAQLKAAAQEGNGEAFDEEILTKQWLQEKRRAPTILKVMTKSKAAKMVRVGIKLTVADNASKNVNFPLTEIKENLFSNDSKQAFVFLKIDPSKDTWGDIECEVTVKEGKTTQISSGYTSTSYNTNAGGYYGSTSYSSSGGMGTQTGGNVAYKPVGSSEGSTKVGCANCDNEVYVGEEYCNSCGKSTTEWEGV